MDLLTGMKEVTFCESSEKPAGTLLFGGAELAPVVWSAKP